MALAFIKDSMTNSVDISIYGNCATKWHNLNNRGCLTHGRKDNGKSATKWLNYLQHCSAHSGAEDMFVIFSVGLQPTVIKISPFQGDKKRLSRTRDNFLFEPPTPNVIEPNTNNL